MLDRKKEVGKYYDIYGTRFCMIDPHTSGTVQTIHAQVCCVSGGESCAQQFFNAASVSVNRKKEGDKGIQR